MTIKTIIFLLFLCTLVAACAHKIDIQQGNVTTKEMVENLKVGMNVRQVMSVLGSPLVVDPFHDNRWDYVYSMKLGNRNVSQYSHVTLIFKDNVLNEINIEAPPIPEKELIAPELVTRGRS
ncbi:MAG: outer membrane protein assembly factor BamE [Gammaproteobacteria bacterium]